MHLPYLLAGTVIREEVGLTLDKAGKEVLGTASKVVLTKDSTTIVGDGSTQEAVNKRVSQIKNQIEVSLSLLTNDIIILVFRRTDVHNVKEIVTYCHNMCTHAH
jgi:hypothetical protein